MFRRPRRLQILCDPEQPPQRAHYFLRNVLLLLDMTLDLLQPKR